MVVSIWHTCIILMANEEIILFEEYLRQNLDYHIIRQQKVICFLFVCMPFQSSHLPEYKLLYW